MLKYIKNAIVLLSVVRGYNILIIVIAQYLTSIYILSDSDSAWDVLTNYQLFFIILSISFVIAAGYIVNDFYDREKDIINKPSKTILDSKVSKTSKLSAYFMFNSLSFVVAISISWRVALFVSFYAFIIWLYSHKFKKITIVGNVHASVLAVFPFFGVFLYYNNISATIFLHASFLFLLILIREISKDMMNYRGDLIYSYQTIPVKYGLKTAKLVISFLVLITAIPGMLLIYFGEIGSMQFYFISTFGVLFMLLLGMWKINGIKWYLLQYNVIKFLILTGVFSIFLISLPN